MDYAQPIAIVEYVSQIQAPNCQTILDKLQNGQIKEPPSLIYGVNSIQAALNAFPSGSTTLIDKLELGNSQPPSSNFFYKYPSSKGWDISLFVNEKGMPFILYHAQGSIVKDYAIILPGDSIFQFYNNPLDANETDFDLNKLKMYIKSYKIICVNEVRSVLDDEFMKLQSRKDKDKKK